MVALLVGAPGSAAAPSSPGTAQPGPSSTRREAHVQAGVYAPSPRLSRPPNSNGTNTHPPSAILVQNPVLFPPNLARLLQSLSRF